MRSDTIVVLFVDEQRALELDDEAVVQRWKQLFRGTLLVDRYMAGHCNSASVHLVGRCAATKPRTAGRRRAHQHNEKDDTSLRLTELLY